MSRTPFSYQEYNLHDSCLTPSTVHVSGSGLSLFFQRYFLQRAMSVFTWRLPKWWAKDYFLTCLYYFGYVGVFNTDRFGVICQECGLKGYNVFYEPTTLVISNPLIRNTLEPTIGVNAEVIKLAPDYRGIYDIISYYGDQMALTSQALGMNLVNSKLAYVFLAGNKAQAESLKGMYDQVQEGNPAVVADKSLFNPDGTPNWTFIQSNLREMHISPTLLEELQTIQNMFDTEIGVPNANITKRERLVTDEVNANNIQTFSKAALWLEELQDCCWRVNAMFDLDLSVDWRFTPREVVGDVSSVD